MALIKFLILTLRLVYLYIICAVRLANKLQKCTHEQQPDRQTNKARAAAAAASAAVALITKG
jgi:hypothetical protein